jgi:hypothetical protein
MATVRRVRRIIRRIDPWTVLKVSTVLYFVAALALVLGAVMFWSVLNSARIPQRLTDFLVEITLLDEGENPFADGDRFLRLAVFGSLVWAIVSTGLTTLAAVMYNLVADVVGGVEVVVLEEHLAIPAPVVSPQAGTFAPPARYQTTPPPAGNGNSSVDLPTEETPVVGRR